MMDRERIRWALLARRQARVARGGDEVVAPRAESGDGAGESATSRLIRHVSAHGRGTLATQARRTSLAFLLLLSPQIHGCSSPRSSSEAPRIDMSSDEAAARSIGLVRDALSEQQRQQLTDATVVLVRHALGPDRAGALDPDKARAAVKQALDGRTAAEVIAEAQALQATGNTPPPPASATSGAGATASAPGGDRGAGAPGAPSGGVPGGTP